MRRSAASPPSSRCADLAGLFPLPLQDVRLEVPIAVRGRVVFWIDRKASFADPLVHAEKGLPQFQAYVNRYGPGLVIYWMGYVAELDTHPQVALASSFPSSADINRLPGGAAPMPLPAAGALPPPAST